MSEKNKATYPIKNQIQEEMTVHKIFETTTGPLFHYTSREVFWKIIEDESFLARHILFSNDFEEYELGKTFIQKKLKLNDNESEHVALHNEKYMICFCKEDDLLSQWRGYAKNGIAMSFDFSLGIPDLNNNIFSPYHCFTLVNNGSVPKKSEILAKTDDPSPQFDERYLSSGLYDSEKYISLCVTAPHKVCYIEKNKRNSELSAALKELALKDDIVKSASKLIPYIKNKKFDEEKEYRLIFNLTDLYKPQMECFIGGKITYLDIDGLKKPNIRVEFGNAQDYLEDNKPIKIYYRNTSYQSCLEKIKEEMQHSNPPIITELALITDTSLKKNDIWLSNGRNQEKVTWKLYELFAEEKNIFSKAKIWCDWHLPIRQIIVGPSKDAELMKESIIQYKNNKYWMKSIDVKVSEIPYRD